MSKFERFGYDNNTEGLIFNRKNVSQELPKKEENIKTLPDKTE